MSKILANEIANYGDDSPIDLKEGLNIPAGNQYRQQDRLVLRDKSCLLQVLQCNG